MNSVDDILRTLVAEQIEPIKSKLEEIAKALQPKNEGDCFISPSEAGKILGCGDDIIKKLQDVGQLTLCFKPTVIKEGKEKNQNRHRVVLKSEVLELFKKCIVRPAKKKK
jgi:hypothetical protein